MSTTHVEAPVTSTVDAPVADAKPLRVRDVLIGAGGLLWYVIIGAAYLLGIGLFAVGYVSWYLLLGSLYVFGFLLVGMLIACFWIVAFPVMLLFRL